MRIIFWGTPEYSVASLNILNKSDHEVIAVISQPDKKRSRGKKLVSSPVKVFAKNENIPVVDLYFSKKGKRYRSLGDNDITFPVKSSAKSIDEIIEELKVSKTSERSGRAMDHEEENVFERLRSKGYM